MGIALDHFSESERERIARSLFEVKTHDAKKGELHGLCPLHGEKNSSFSYNYRSDVYNCFSCGEGGDLVRLWYKLRGYSSDAEGFQAFCREFGIDPAEKRDRSTSANVESRSEEKEPPGDLEGVWELFEPLPESRIRELEASRGWTRRTLELMDIRLQTHYLNKQGALVKLKRDGRIAIPVRLVDGKLANIRLYKPGDPLKILSWAKQYGSSRLFPAAPLLSSDPVLLCEGEPDTLCALSNGFNAITQTSKTKNWSEKHLTPFRGREVVIAYDADQAGQKYAIYAADALIDVAKTVRLLEWPDYMGRQPDGSWPKDHGDDLTDFLVKHQKKPSDLLELINQAKIYDSKSTEARPGPLQFFERGVNERLSFKPRLLAEKVMRESSLLFEPATGLLYKWNGRIWETYDEEHVGSICIKHLEKESQKSRVEDAVYQVKRLTTIPHNRKMNDRTDWICIQNGLLNLHTLDLQPHDKDFLCTFFLPVEYNEDSSRICDRFLEYLDQTVQTEDVIAQMQEFAGYCLTPSTEYEKCLLLLGPGADGKSTFLKILRELVGPDNCASVSFNDLDDQFQRSSLYGKLLNISTEVGSKAIESPYFKAITSGDPLNAAFKHRNTFTFEPTVKLAFSANRLPRVLDNSDGFFRRLLPIQFKRQFLEDADPHLFQTLKSEISEIFHWAILGLHRLWDQKGFTNCNETREILMGYRRANNPILCYVEDQCVLDEAKEVKKSELYKNYRSYCGEKGYSPLNEENFFRELYAAIHNLKQYRPRVKGTREYMLKGIGFNVEPE
jgi:putative DNA primase/helicase